MSPHPVRSFDVFDTLIARKNFTPQAVFSIVEQRCAVPGFSRLRFESALALQPSGHTLSDIYREIGRRAGVDSTTLARLQDEELRVELEQVIPVAENLSRVRDGDTLITDMYLDEATILRLLQQAGLRKQVQLIRTTHGKASGKIWTALRERGLRAAHVGDNAHSDVVQARAAEHLAEHTRTAGISEVEEYLFRQGFTGTALLARALRLTRHEKSPIEEQLRRVQAQINIPLLIVASLQLVAYTSTNVSRPGKLLFCSRDCAGWLKIFNATQSLLDVPPIPAGYFYTSRLARRNASADYVAYSRHLMSDNALIVDLCGTGLSMQRFLDAVSPDTRCLYLFKANTDRVLATSREIYPDQSAERVQGLIDNHLIPDATPTAGELMNLVDHGMTVDARAAFGGFLPLLAELEFSAQQIGWIQCMTSEVERALSFIIDPTWRDQFRLRDALVPPERARETMSALWSLAGRSAALAQCFATTHQQRDQEIHRLLLGQIPA